LKQRLRETATREEFLNIAEAHGYLLSDEDLHALGRLVRAHAERRAEEALSEEELLPVTGGTGEGAHSGPQETEGLDFIKFFDEIGFIADYYIFKNL